MYKIRKGEQKLHGPLQQFFCLFVPKLSVPELPQKQINFQQ